MSKIAKLSIGIGCFLLITLIAAVVFLRHLVVKSFPQTRGKIMLSVLQAPVDVIRDDYGVPHIRAQNEHDLMVAVGYVQAQDRLWQMDLMRRAGEGRLAEIFGKEALSTDLLFRTLDLRDLARKVRDQMHPEARQLLDDYAAGVNAFISSHRGKYPVEFDMLSYEPEPWSPEQSILISRLIAWELNLAWWTDLTYGEIAAKVTPEKLQEIMPAATDTLPVAVPRSALRKAFASLHGFLDAGRAYRSFFRLGPIEAGSNAWVVDSSRSLSGKPLLANDPHLAMPAPSRWYEMHLTAPGWNVAGVSLAGLPLIVIGHNDRIAWGLTNAMLDDADFYIEKIDTARPDHYLYQGSSLPIEVREEKIMIRPSDSMLVSVRSTRHGPIINDVHPVVRRRTDSLRSAEPVAMRWTGLDISDEVDGFRLMNRASGMHEFENGLREITVPGQVVLYADVEGNIASWTTGHVPIRGKGNPMLPLPGWTGEAEWRGYVPFDQLPRTVNPRSGTIASANQKMTDKNYPYYLSTLWEPPSRILRIRELLTSTERFTAEDFQQFQQDLVSVEARQLVRMVLQAYGGTRTEDQDVTSALNYFQNWDYRFTRQDVATTIYHVFFVKLLQNIFRDEMGDELFSDFIYYGAIPHQVTAQLLAADSSAWFEDVTTGRSLSRDDILRKSFGDALHELESTRGPEMKTWQWGELHTVTFHHPFGSRAPLDRVFNIGPFPIGGGESTVNLAEELLTAPYAVFIGASMRQVVDLARPSGAWTVITSGESGQALNKHYDDQTSLWLNGGYHRVTTDWQEISQASWDHLELVP